MKFSLCALIPAFAAGLVAAAPTNTTSGNPYVVVQNDCSSSLHVGESKNGELSGTSVVVNAGAKHTFTFPQHWAGRVWGRTSCEGKNCTFAGIGAPASLAEFYFKDHKGDDYYDISFVDGFNIPLKITPIQKTTSNNGDNHYCGTPTCAKLPVCEKGFETYDSHGKVAGCQSACTKFGSPEYCCTGDFISPDVCKATNYSKKVKEGCPNAYSYAYDDATSVYQCQSSGYTVTFCPKN